MLQQVMVGWTYTWILTPVLMKLNGSPRLALGLLPLPKYAYGVRTDCCNAFPQFFKYGSESSREQKFHGAKVLGTFAHEERKFHRCESSMERKFLDFSLHVSECSREWKFHGN